MSNATFDSEPVDGSGYELVPLSSLLSGPSVRVNLRTEWQKREPPVYEKSYVHKALDIAANSGTPIYAPGSGDVIESSTQWGKNKKDEWAIVGWGHYLKIYFPKTDTTLLLAHLQKRSSLVKGDTFSSGDLLAYTGNSGTGSGPHLHIEAWRGGERVRPSSIFNLGE